MTTFRTTADVRAYCIEVVRVIAAMTKERGAVMAATIASVAFACMRYADQQGPAPSAQDGERIHAFLTELWTSPESHFVARERLADIASVAALEAMAASVPGTAWAELAGHEVARRRGEIADWGFVNKVLTVKKLGA